MAIILSHLNSRQYSRPTKRQVLESIEKGAKQTAAFIKGRKKLREAKELLLEF